MQAPCTLLAIEEKEWESAVGLLAELIQCHPLYASEGLGKAQGLVLEYMEKRGWDFIFEDCFMAADIRDDPAYVEVAQFGSLYAEYETVAKRNIIGIIESGRPGPTILLNGHIDVDIVTAHRLWEHKENSGKRIGSRLYGRGAADMLSGLVSLLALANHLSQNRSFWSGKIILTVVTDEEIGGNGTLRSLRWLKDRGLLQEIESCLIAEPSDRKICRSSLGFLHIRCLFEEKPLHMGAAKKENSPVWRASCLIQEFETLLLRAAKKVDPLICIQELVFNFGVLKGGEDPAIPPSELHLEGVIFHPQQVASSELQKELAKELKARFPDIALDWGAFRFEGAKYPSSPLFEALLRTAPLGVTEGGFRSPCDARLFRQCQIPTVIYGPGSLAQAHAVDEFICLKELRRYIDHLIRCFLFQKELYASY